MHVAVLLCGVADPRRPLARPATGKWLDLIDAPTTPFKLSPFDEAALEVALKLRDRDPSVRVTALVTDGAGDVALMRTVASFRPDFVAGIPTPADRRADPDWLSHAIPAALNGLAAPPVDLWLMGREQGDLDDGVAPAFIAERWGLPFVGLALAVQRAGHAWQCDRIFGNQVQTIRVPGPVVASVTNDRGNRLRHPLMKNVALARQLKIDMLNPGDTAMHTPAGSAAIGQISRIALEPLESGRRTKSPCRMLEGSVADQAQALADYLRAGHATPVQS
ncbi:MAG: hypothetical protein WCP99_05805 [Burkholderiales bacterium]